MTAQNKELIFYHIPKTGGIWVRRSLENIGIEVARVANVKRPELMLRFYKEFNLIGGHSCPRTTQGRHKKGRFSFAFVRHPLTWYRSFYAFRIISGFIQKERMFAPDCALDFNSYDNYIRNLLDMFPGFLTKYYQYYVGEDLGEVDFIGRQENLYDDFIKAMDMSGVMYDKSKIDGNSRENAAYEANKRKKYHGKSFEEQFTLSEDLEKELLHEERWIIDNFYKDSSIYLK